MLRDFRSPLQVAQQLHRLGQLHCFPQAHQGFLRFQPGINLALCAGTCPVSPRGAEGGTRNADHSLGLERSKRGHLRRPYSADFIPPVASQALNDYDWLHHVQEGTKREGGKREGKSDSPCFIICL